MEHKQEGAAVEKKGMKVDMGRKQQYAKPILVKHGKLKDVTAVKVGSAGGKGPVLGCTRLFG
jgi:hypothetical protein